MVTPFIPDLLFNAMVHGTLILLLICVFMIMINTIIHILIDFLFVLISLSVFVCISINIDATRNSVTMEIMELFENHPTNVNVVQVNEAAWVAVMSMARKRKQQFHMAMPRFHFQY